MNAWFRVPDFYYGANVKIDSGICFMAEITNWLTHICLKYTAGNAAG